MKKSDLSKLEELEQHGVYKKYLKGNVTVFVLGDTFGEVSNSFNFQIPPQDMEVFEEEVNEKT